jgi:hypothetical protein
MEAVWPEAGFQATSWRMGHKKYKSLVVFLAKKYYCHIWNGLSFTVSEVQFGNFLLKKQASERAKFHGLGKTLIIRGLEGRRFRSHCPIVFFWGYLCISWQKCSSWHPSTCGWRYDGGCDFESHKFVVIRTHSGMEEDIGSWRIAISICNCYVCTLRGK